MTTIYYLEITDPVRLNSKECPPGPYRVDECIPKLWPLNRFMYRLVGDRWQWFDKLSWSDDDWQRYVDDPSLRTWMLYHRGTPAGYYELRRTDETSTEIAYFGLVPQFIGKGLGGYLLTHAIRTAFEAGARRVWVHTCSKDHPQALANYQARGMTIFKTEENA
ncbi:GNAT family N-acetyltransferase [Thermostilla marina]